MQPRFTISIHYRNNATEVCRRMAMLHGQNPSAQAEVIVANDASTDGSPSVVETAAASFPNARVVSVGVKKGAPACHNRALEIASGAYFIVLDAGMEITEDGWLEKLCLPFSSGANTALCGVAGTPSRLDSGAEGTPDPARSDYADASCLAVPTALARKYGLFGPDMPSESYADKDLALRYRQMGYSVSHVPLSHKLVRPEPDGKPDLAADVCKRRFLARWGECLRTGVFNNRILVDASEVFGAGDLLCITPALTALRAAHPTAEIVLWAKATDIFAGNPDISRAVSEKPAGPFDSVLQPGLGCYYHGRKPLVRSLAYDMGVEPSSDKLILNPGPSDIVSRSGLSGKDYIVVNLKTGHKQVGWEGRSLSHDDARAVCEWIIDEGCTVVQVGSDQEDIMDATEGFVSLVDKTDLDGLAALLTGSRGAVLVDSFPLHVAQALGVRTFTFFGATLPEYRITDFATTDWYERGGLDCTGCYHGKPEGGFNKCLRGDIACMTGIADERLEMRLRAFIKGGAISPDFVPMLRRAQELVGASEAMSQEIMMRYGSFKNIMNRFRPDKIGRGILRKLMGGS